MGIKFVKFDNVVAFDECSNSETTWRFWYDATVRLAVLGSAGFLSGPEDSAYSQLASMIGVSWRTERALLTCLRSDWPLRAQGGSLVSLYARRISIDDDRSKLLTPRVSETRLTTNDSTWIPICSQNTFLNQKYPL